MRKKRSADGESVPSWSSALVGGAIAAIPGTEKKYDGSIRTVSVAFFANLIIAIAKYGGFFLVHSSALLAEAIHSTAVTTNQGLMLYGHLFSSQPATAQHPFGFGRVRYFWAFMVSVVMFGIGSVLSISRGVLSITSGTHHEITMIWIPYAVLTLGLVLDGLSFMQAARQAHHDKGNLSYWEYIKRSKNPEIPVVLSEDFAAIIGLLFAYAGITLTLITGNAVYDGIASILIGLLLAVVAFVIAREMSRLLIGESALPEETEAIEKVIASHDAVRQLVYFRSLYLGPEELLVEAKVRFVPTMRSSEVASAIDQIEKAIRVQIPHASIISIEPDIPKQNDVEIPPYAQKR